MNPFCSSRIRPDCLKIDEHGTARVFLSAPARPFFEALSGLGETLQLTRNRGMIMGSLSTFPVLDDWTNPVFPKNRAGLLAINLAQISDICATCETSEAGPIYGFELYQLDGFTSQKILLTDNSRMSLFSDMTAEWQSAKGNRTPWAPANHAASLSHIRMLRSRVSYLRYREAAIDGSVRSFSLHLARKIFARILAKRFFCKITFYNPAVIRHAAAMPDFECRFEDGSSTIESVMGADFSLHFNPGGFRSLWLCSGHCPQCGEPHHTLEFGDANDRLSLVISPALKSQETDFRDKLFELFEGEAAFEALPL
jgi:hypothetical protein